MGSKAVFIIIASAGLLAAQDGPLDPYSSVRFDLPANSPISMLSAKYGDSRATARGGALVLDLHMALTLRNQDSRRIRGVTMLISAQEGAPGGRASQTFPTLDVGPGESFPVRIDVSLIRPLQAGSGPLVQVSLDGVLFEGLSFYGPNRLNSRRSLTFWELENQRDRKYFKQVLATKGAAGLQQEMLDSLTRQSTRRGIDVRVVRAAGPPPRLQVRRIGWPSSRFCRSRMRPYKRWKDGQRFPVTKHGMRAFRFEIRLLQRCAMSVSDGC